MYIPAHLLRHPVFQTEPDEIDEFIQPEYPLQQSIIEFSNMVFSLNDKRTERVEFNFELMI